MCSHLGFWLNLSVLEAVCSGGLHPPLMQNNLHPSLCHLFHSLGTQLAIRLTSLVNNQERPGLLAIRLTSLVNNQARPGLLIRRTGLLYTDHDYYTIIRRHRLKNIHLMR